MSLFVGLDVSQRLTHICVIDGNGKRVWRGKCATDPIILAEAIRAQTGANARVGIETGPLTPWLVHELRAAGVDIVCIEARHAHAVTSLRRINVGKAHTLSGSLYLHGIAVDDAEAQRLLRASGCRDLEGALEWWRWRGDELGNADAANGYDTEDEALHPTGCPPPPPRSPAPRQDFAPPHGRTPVHRPTDSNKTAP